MEVHLWMPQRGICSHLRMATMRPGSYTRLTFTEDFFALLSFESDSRRSHMLYSALLFVGLCTTRTQARTLC